MERITIKDLTSRLNEVDPVSDGMETSEVMVLEDTIWGLENGVCNPLGELQLPIQYANGQFRGENFDCYGLFTLFTHNFFDGIIERIERREGSPRYINEIVEGLQGRIYTYNEGFSDGTSARKVVQGFLEKFFRQYQDLANVNDEEAKECLQRSFIKYEGEKTK